ncbi:hypothetical protein LPJ53_004453 [Coemansia erecta]|uniref:Uncharacterized protein n=1 Tax=Coemansia erecta TaxID=147472 RepID=A0A9W7XUB5_9FUNG|nr:hypothetical protein LPJ53_004453 [Coemansia erecta]
MPEGAIYEYLYEKKIIGVPQVYKRGIVVQEMFGYRLEFIILQHWGYNVKEYMESRCHASNADDFSSTLSGIVRQTFSCLVQTKCHEVLHRDISAGTVANFIRKTYIAFLS